MVKTFPSVKTSRHMFIHLRALSKYNSLKTLKTALFSAVGHPRSVSLLLSAKRGSCVMRFYITPFNLSRSYSGFYVFLRNPIVK